MSGRIEKIRAGDLLERFLMAEVVPAGLQMARARMKEFPPDKWEHGVLRDGEVFYLYAVSLDNSVPLTEREMYIKEHRGFLPRKYVQELRKRIKHIKFKYR